MVTFQKAINWLKEGKKVRRPSWDKNSYWILGIEESIQWANRMHAHVHLNQIEADDWEIYEYKYVEPEALKSFINPGLIPKEFSFGVACKKCAHFHPADMVGFDVLYNCSECDASLFEKKLDDSSLSDKFFWVRDIEPRFYAYPATDVKKCFNKIKGDLVKGKSYNWVEIENIIDKRAGEKLI